MRVTQAGSRRPAHACTAAASLPPVGRLAAVTPTTETGSLFLQPDRNLALELVRATEAAAIRAQPWVGRGEKNLADGAAVDAMRKFQIGRAHV